MNKWPRVSLGELLTLERRPVKVAPDSYYEEIGIYCFGRGIFHKPPRSGLEVGEKDLFLIKSGDFILQITFAWEGAVAVASPEEDGMYGSIRFPTFRVSERKCDPYYLLNYFRTHEGREQLIRICPGSAGRNRVLSIKRIPEVSVPLPPFSDQRRIVAKIDDLAGKIEETRRLRHQATQEDEALTHSFMNQILTKAANIVSWEFGPIPMFANVNPSRTGQIDLKPEDPVSFVPMKAVDVVTGKISWPEVRPFREVTKGYTWFKEGDVIFARITPCMQNGKAAIARNLVSGNGFGSTEFHVIRPGPKLLAEWLHSLVRHKAFREDATKTFKGTAGQQRVPQSFLDQKVIPVPPLSEQRQIIVEIDALQRKVDELKQIQVKTAVELDALLPSILDKAFKGEL